MSIWQPTPEAIANSNMTRFRQRLNQLPNIELNDERELYQWSIDHPERFWPEVSSFCGMVFHTLGTRVLTHVEGTPPAQWFEGFTLNYAQNCLRRQGSDEALVFCNETNTRVSLSFDELRTQVAQLAHTLKRWGITQGDRVAGFCPNRIETVVAMLATTSLGAIWSSCSMDFGTQGALERFAQIKPKVLFTANGHTYNGKIHPAFEKLSALLEQLPSIEHVVLINNIDAHCPLPKCYAFADCCPSNIKATDLEFTGVPFDHPAFILFSSGTTGVPKCIVHGAGGTLLQHLKEHVLHGNLTREDTIFYYSTCGWMMWNWLISALAVGAKVILYDGAPLPKNNPERLMDLIDAEKITQFGASAKYITALEKVGAKPIKTHDLSSLQVIYSTGSPLVPQNYRYVYECIKHDVRLSSISGGTDIISCFALGNPNLPVYIGELQCRGLGMQVEIFTTDGKSVKGEKGELVCTAPFPSMPVSFWNDPGDKKYFHAYFDRFPGVWAHGDFAMLTEHDGLIIYGRSDTVLNPGGVRIGTAEIYRAVEKIDEVVESIAIGQPLEDDEQVVLFVVLKPGHTLDEDLIGRIKERIKTTVSPHHVPKVIKAVPDIPRTISGKIVEIAVRNVVLGQQVDNIDALANPDALKYFENIMS